LGDIFVGSQLIESRDDIFYLSLDEIRQLAEGGALHVSARELVEQRRHEVEEYRDVELPETIYGDESPPIVGSIQDEYLLRAIPTSRGYFKGRTLVIDGVDRFDKMEAGAVLVIPYSDVAWTPLFSKAGAVISESGGMLSHCSIVAREYGIPAVVSLTGACKRLVSGTVVSVDGYKGLVTVQPEEEPDNW
jgi:pyruvate,water dikinase